MFFCHSILLFSILLRWTQYPHWHFHAFPAQFPVSVQQRVYIETEKLLQQKDFCIVTANSVLSVSFVKLSWLVRMPRWSVALLSGTTAADTAAELGCSKLLCVSFDLIGEDLRRDFPCCQTDELIAGAGFCLRQSDERTVKIPPCRWWNRVGC